MELASPAFAPGQAIPDTHTAHGKGVSPPLMISGTPAGTDSLVLIVHDPDAPGGDFVHWLIWNISATATMLPEDHVPSGAVQGVNDFGKIGYGAPAPPSGTHHYVFDVYALNSELTLAEGANRAAVLAAMEGHIVGAAQLVGTVSA